MQPIPDDIRCFIDGYIETIDQLEFLRVLSDHPESSLDVATLAMEAEADTAAAANHLAILHARGLLVSEAGPVYRYGPSTPELTGLVARMLHLYRERPVSIIKAVYTRR